MAQEYHGPLPMQTSLVVLVALSWQLRAVSTGPTDGRRRAAKRRSVPMAVLHGLLPTVGAVYAVIAFCP
eukprot:m.176450 g.176450  ORF g.176450 m.176450 type:complete len:69 (+) comp14171_c0_seq1:1663-1869(+)